MLGSGGTARTTVRKMVKGCGAPAPVPVSVAYMGDGDFDIAVRGLNIRGDTTLVIVPGQVVSISEITNNGKTVVPSGKDVLGSVVTNITLANGTNGEVFAMYLVGPCMTRAFVGLITFTFP